jgi:hypothetical protein
MCKHSKSGKEIGKHGIFERLPYERWVVYLFFGLMAVIAFQVIRQLFFVGYLNMPKCYQEQFLHVEGIIFFRL